MIISLIFSGNSLMMGPLISLFLLREQLRRLRYQIAVTGMTCLLQLIDYL